MACIDFTVLREDQINLSGFIKTYDQAKGERQLFDGCIMHKTAKLEPLNSDPMIINMEVLLKLFAKLPGNPCDVKIRALRIIFGLENDKVIFFFSPVALTRAADEEAETEITYSMDENSPVYVYNASNRTFDSAEPEYYANCKSNYYENIRIQRHDGSDFYDIQDDGDWDSDTQEVIFSFQEIFHLYHMAYPCTAELVYDKDLYFYNGAANYRHHRLNILTKWRRKHTIFITLEDLEHANEDVVGALVATNEAANLAHLCPPNCSPIYYVTEIYPCP